MLHDDCFTNPQNIVRKNSSCIVVIHHVDVSYIEKIHHSMTFNKEIIVILAPTNACGSKIANELGVSDNHLVIQNKYFSASVPVEITTQPCAFNGSIRGVIVVDLVEHISEYENLSDDAIKIFLTDSENHLDACIENGFELVLRYGNSDDAAEDFGVTRIKAALQCRIWNEAQPSASMAEYPSMTKPDTAINEFEDLMQRVKSMHESAKSGMSSDSVRRKNAAAIASELANLLGVDSESE